MKGVPRPPSARDVARVAVGAADAQPPLVGDTLWRPLDRLFQRTNALVRRALPDVHNPLLHLGALANLALIVAIVSGVVLLIWYTPSHTGAWESTRAMGDDPWVAGLVRSLHRYSSDAALLAALLHGLQILAGRRVAGPRWVAWVTGLLGVGFIWLVGWLGYWLVWDERAQLVAVGTARALDVLPIFSDPLGRSFIINEGVSSLLFFVVFFCHMLLPLLMGVVLWLHLTRLARPRFLASRTLTAWALVALVVLSLVAPASIAAPADMGRVPASLTMDWWYLLPVFLTDRLSGGALWLLALGGGVLAFGVPWYLVRRRCETHGMVVELAPTSPHDAPCSRAEARAEPGAPGAPVADEAESTPPSLRRAAPARVDPARCNACETCFVDCPYDAISMVARSDGRKFPSVAWVDPARCVGCGVCAGSCDASGIALPGLSAPHERRRIDAWLEAAPAASTLVAFLCARSAAAGLERDAATDTAPALPGYRVVAVPCAGWVHPLSIERALRRGAAGVLVVGCRPGSCAYREGATWTAERIAGRREPVLRTDHLDAARVLHLALDAFEPAALVTAAASFRASCLTAEPTSRAPGATPAVATPATETPTATRRVRIGAALAGLVVTALSTLLVWLPSDLPYHTPATPEPQLVVSFKVAGAVTERCRVLDAAELERLPPHKRVPKVCERGREPVRLVVSIDGAVVHDALYEPSGAFGDGASVALTTLAVPVGRHAVAVAVGMSNDPAALRRDARDLDLSPHTRRVVVFDDLAGFTWH